MDVIKMEHKRVSVDALGRMSNDELKRHGYFASEQAELNFNLSPGMIALSSGRPGEDILRKSSLEIQKATHRRFVSIKERVVPGGANFFSVLRIISSLGVLLLILQTFLSKKCPTSFNFNINCQYFIESWMQNGGINSHVA